VNHHIIKLHHTPNLLKKLYFFCGTPGKFYGQMFLVISAFVLGTLLILKPEMMIRLQINIYRLFNWKAEPISMKKELSTSRIMGSILIIAGISSIVCMIIF